MLLQVLDRDEGNDHTSEEEQEPEVWEDVSMEDLLCDIESRELCPEPTPKQTRTQKLTALVQWLVYFLLMWQSLCKLSDNGLEWLLQFLFQFFKVLSDLSGCEYLGELVTIIPSSLYLHRCTFFISLQVLIVITLSSMPFAPNVLNCVT